jgi:polar amino acid transport system substrate-binding protein
VEACDLSQLVDLNGVVKSALALVDNQVKNATRQFSVNYAPTLPAVRGNAQRLEQVVVNLVQNACEALTTKRQAVVVSTAHDHLARSIVVEIRDQGVGISPAELAHIMEPFYTTKRGSGGTGLGLSVSASVVKDHGGTLSFVSVPGEGTVATLRLPEADGRPATHEAVR